MASINFPIATILFFLLPAIAIAIKVPRPHTEVSDFVSQSCKLTKYPDLCIKTLSPFAKSIKQDDLSAVLLNSLDATLSAAKHSRKRLSGFYIDSNATKPEPGSTKLDGVLKFCVDSHVDAVGQLERAINIVKNIGSVNEEVLGFSFAGADYDLALCLTDMNECIDHWKVIPNGYVKTEIFRSSEKVRKHVVISRDILKKFQFVMDSKIKHKGLLL